MGIEVSSYDHTVEFLTKMGAKFIEKQETQTLILAHLIHNKYYHVNIVCEPKWIYTYVLIMNGLDIPEEKKKDIFRELLILNKQEKDLTFSLDEEDNIYSENDSPYNTDYEAFKSEYIMTVKGIELFIEKVAKKFGLEMFDTVAAKKNMNYIKKEDAKIEKKEVS